MIAVNKFHDLKSLYSKVFTAVILLMLFESCASNRQPIQQTESQVYTVSGKVLDKLTRESLVGVHVSIIGTQLNVYTNIDGFFEIYGVGAGTYKFRFELPGYLNKTVDNVVVKNKAVYFGVSLEAEQVNIWE